MWEIEFLVSAGRLREQMGSLLTEFLTTRDFDRAADLMLLIESLVAPVSGGLTRDAEAAGSEMPNLELTSPRGDLTIHQDSTTVENRTPISDLLSPNMGNCHWAACLNRY